MFTAFLKFEDDTINIVVNEEISNVNHIRENFNLTIGEAKTLRMWLNGMADSVSPLECQISGREFYFDYDIWYPMRDVINKWYEDNYARI